MIVAQALVPLRPRGEPAPVSRGRDLKFEIIDGLLRIDPTVEIIRARDAGLSDRPDSEVLEYAARHGRILVSHDSNTMTAHAAQRIQAGLPMPGLIIIHQWTGTGNGIRWLSEVWEATEAEEWLNQITFAQ